MRELLGHTAGVERLENGKAKITIIIDPDTFEKGLKKSYEINKNKISIPGFRRGKVPRRIIEAQMGKQFFYEDAINEILPDAYDNAVEEYDLTVVSRPELDVPEAEAGVGAVVTAVVTLKPAAVIEGYKGLEYEAVDLNVTDEEVDKVVASELEKNARFVPVEDRPVEDGDITRIDFEGFVDGVAFEGGKGADFELIIGSGRFIPGFEEQIIGMNLDETRDVIVTFPESYHAEHLAGKEAVFKVTLNELHIKEVPEIDDEFAMSVSDFDTLDEYKTDVREKLAANKVESAEQSKEEALAVALSKQVEVDLPQVMVDTEINYMIQGFARNIQSRGIRFEQYMEYTGMTTEGLRDSYRYPAERNVRARLALETIAINERFTVSDEEIEAEIKEMAERYEMEADTLKESMSPRETRALGLDLRVQKAMKYVIEHAVEKSN